MTKTDEKKRYKKMGLQLQILKCLNVSEAEVLVEITISSI